MEITRQLKDKIFQRDGYKCVYCLKIYEPSLLHVDHIKPKSKGGLNSSENLVTACSKCNLKKNNQVLKVPPVVVGLKVEMGDYSLSTRQSYPQRGFSLSDPAWAKLKTAKIQSGLTWTNFILDLLKRKNV